MWQQFLVRFLRREELFYFCEISRKHFSVVAFVESKPKKTLEQSKEKQDPLPKFTLEDRRSRKPPTSAF